MTYFEAELALEELKLGQSRPLVGVYLFVDLF